MRPIFRSCLFVLLLLLCFPTSIYPKDYYESLISDGELEHLKGVLKPHELFWLHTPSSEEIKEKTCDIQESRKKECMTWLKDVMNPNIIYDNMENELVPMKKWWRPTEDYQTKGGSAVFITQLTTGSLAIRIIENYDRVVVIASFPEIKIKTIEIPLQKQFIQTIAKSVLSKRLQPINLSRMYIYNNRINEYVLMGTWIPDANIREETKPGIFSVLGTRDAITDYIDFYLHKHFILFNIYKCNDSPRALDPYRIRFK